MALYGHPDSGTLWEEHCDTQVKTAGFDALGLSWPSCYFHRKLNLFLVIYVDDFKMAGPKGTIKQGWDLLQKKGLLLKMKLQLVRKVYIILDANISITPYRCTMEAWPPPWCTTWVISYNSA